MSAAKLCLLNMPSHIHVTLCKHHKDMMHILCYCFQEGFCGPISLEKGHVITTEVNLQRGRSTQTFDVASLRCTIKHQGSGKCDIFLHSGVKVRKSDSNYKTAKAKEWAWAWKPVAEAFTFLRIVPRDNNYVGQGINVDTLSSRLPLLCFQYNMRSNTFYFRWRVWARSWDWLPWDW